MLIYLAHPVSGPTPGAITANLLAARRWLAWAIDHFPAVSPIAPWIVTCEVLDDAREAHRARGMSINEATIMRCDAVWLTGGRVSKGMLAEARMAMGAGIPVVDFTHLGVDPPALETPVAGVAWTPSDYAKIAKGSGFGGIIRKMFRREATP